MQIRMREFEVYLSVGRGEVCAPGPRSRVVYQFCRMPYHHPIAERGIASPHHARVQDLLLVHRDQPHSGQRRSQMPAPDLDHRLPTRRSGYELIGQVK
jgi:hypothetical protein